jgi:hypothetical protein
MTLGDPAALVVVMSTANLPGGRPSSQQRDVDFAQSFAVREEQRQTFVRRAKLKVARSRGILQLANCGD